jgi:DNA-binding GntR family transcriptional regulator
MRGRRGVDSLPLSSARGGCTLASRSFARPQSLAEQAADQIRHRIVKGDFRLGEALSETALAAELGISKTPVREAFLRLKTEGLVDVLPQRGTFVFRIGATEARKLSEFREVLEISALRLAMAEDAAGLGLALGAIAADMSAALADNDTGTYQELDGIYHQCIIDRCDNHHLSRSYAVIAFRIQALRHRLAMDPALNANSLEQHHKIALLIGQAAEPDAIALLKRHIAKTQDDYANTLSLGIPTELG